MLRVGSSYTTVIVADEQIIRKIADVSGDKNPIHLDDMFANNSKFGRRIAHGLFCLNAISMIIGNHLPGKGSMLCTNQMNDIVLDGESLVSWKDNCI